MFLNPCIWYLPRKVTFLSDLIKISQNGKLQLRKWQTIQITGGSCSSASRQVSLQSVVNSRIHARQKEVMKSYTRLKNNFYMKESETSTTLWTCSKKSQYYSHLKNMINQHDQEIDIEKCIQFINKIKQHRHSKIKERYIDKFEYLYFKRFGYHHNLTRHTQNFDNIDQDHTLSRHQNVPSRFSTTTPEASSNPSVPATPMGPTPSSSAASVSTPPTTAPRHPPSSSRIHVKLKIVPKGGSSTCPKPPSLQISYPSYKKAQTLP